MFNFKALERRLIVLLVVPVTLFLLNLGVAGYRFTSGLLFKEWQDTANLRLERAAHQMDMRLDGQIKWMEEFARAGQDHQGKEIQAWLLRQEETQAGVVQVNLTWKKATELQKPTVIPERSAKISAAGYFYPPGGKTVGMGVELLDAGGQPLGRLEVILSYDYLMQDIIQESWLVAQMACLVTRQGCYLAHSSPAMQARHCLGETRNPLELAMLKAMQEKPSGTLMGKERLIGYHQLHAAPWVIMLHAQASQILAPIIRFRLYYLATGILCLIVILVLIHLGVHPVVKAIGGIAAKATQVARGNYGKLLPVARRDEIGQLTSAFNDMVAGLKERDFISDTFGRYMDREIARELLSRPEASRMGGVKREVVILFADIRGFTPLAEFLTPEATISLINRHFSRMIEVIQAHRGIIVDFLGDAILAFFDPLDDPLEAVVRRAIGCSLKMQTAMAAENLTKPWFPPLRQGIGLHAGEVVVGNIGSEIRTKYGIIGAAVNLTHRIQGQAQGGEVVVSEMVFQHCQETLAVKRTFETALKGITQPVTLYVVEGMKEVV